MGSLEGLTGNKGDYMAKKKRKKKKKNSKQFNRQFKKLYGMTPLEYRNSSTK